MTRPVHPLRVLAQPAFTRRELNPYNFQLYTSLAAEGVEVREFSRDEVRRGEHDIWHLHWPDVEAQFTRGSLPLIVRRATRLLLMLRAARRRGTRVVWTVHNLHSHEHRFPRLERWFWRLFVGQLDGAITLSHDSCQDALRVFPGLARVPITTVPLGHFRGSYPNTVGRTASRTALGISPGAAVLAFVGQIRRYKNLPGLIAAFGRFDDPGAVLLIAGRPAPASLGRELECVARGDSRIHLHLGLVADDEMQLYLNAADVVVLPYREILNSASALLALSFDRPVLAPAIGSLPELRRQVGEEWVRLYDGQLTGETLRDAVQWASATPRAAAAPLEAFEWQSVARDTLTAYRTVLAPPKGGVPK